MCWVWCQARCWTCCCWAWCWEWCGWVVPLSRCLLASHAVCSPFTLTARDSRCLPRLLTPPHTRRHRKLEWFDEGLKSSKFQRIVILKHMFVPAEVDADPGLLLDLKDDVRGECERLGAVVNVTVFDRHPDGVCSVKFKDEAAAAACVELMDGRYFAGRRVEAAIYDGATKYDAFSSAKAEDADDEAERLRRYGDWLEQQQRVYDEHPATPP
eukprot:Unigene14799_Nuclearia_a/m.44487 Unigene14799_Nuclearia_a/g.44487  ORF Unigene14799_Nuclearia_a/g.44487 Unigene14799_Nuclearia_a/m.44487 type:complete len:212 (+) Unigene14799_Nuclearia_a:464-1099(+)